MSELESEYQSIKSALALVTKAGKIDHERANRAEAKLALAVDALDRINAMTGSAFVYDLSKQTLKAIRENQT